MGLPMRDPLPTDLTASQWAAIEPLLPPPLSGGRKREVDLREVVNALLHLFSSGCGWRNLPDGFPNRSTVRHYYDLWRQAGIWDQILTLVNASSNANTDSKENAGKRPLDKGEHP